MKRLLFAATMLATLFVSCMKSEIEVVTVIPSSKEFTASFDDATRTELDGTTVVWNEEDLLTIFTKTSHNRKYEIKSLSSDCRTATFSYVGFTGTDGTKITTNYALYPYDAEATLANGVITTEWASEQTYDAETGNLSYALMTAASETTNFTFANAGALLRFKLSKIVPDDFTLRGIKLTSATQNIAGEITIDLNGNKRAVVTDNGVDSITLEAIDTEITLDVQEFYIALPAMSFDKGDLSVTFMFDEGNKEFALPAFELVQGSIKNIEYTIKDAEEFTGSTPNDGPANNEIWYTTASEPDTYTVLTNSSEHFGSNIVSHDYDADKGCWVIKFDGEVTKIGDYVFWYFGHHDIITTITIPNSVTSIGEGAFGEHINLTRINIPENVTSIGSSAFYGCSSLTSITIPDSVTSIGDYAFYSCDSLTSVTIGNGVTEIGERAFYDCSSLKSITIPDSVTSIGYQAFGYCDSLTSITIPDSVTSIGDYAFYSCDSLTSVTIGNGVTEIGERAFYDCSSLKSITIPDSVTTIGMYAFASCDDLTSVTIGDSVTTIGSSAFSGCSSLTSVTIGSGVTSIGDYAFYNCSSLKSITIPDSVTTIGDYAFRGCSSLTSVTIGSGVTSIGDYAFYNCSSLKSITIPDSVTTIGNYAFNGCSSLTNMTIGKGVTSIGNYAFYGCTGELIVNCNIPSASSSSSGAFYNYKFTKVTIGDSVTSIGSYVFYNCSSLKSFSGKYASQDGRCLINNGNLIAFAPAELTEYTIPDGITSIGSSAFYGCSGLKSITIPDSVTTIEDYAFIGCNGLKSIIIPDGVTTIGECAIGSCSGLTSITIPDSVTTIGEGTFADCDNLRAFHGKFASLDNNYLIVDGVLISAVPFDHIEIPDIVTAIGGLAFISCDYLTSVTIPDSVTEIGERAFAWCNRLTSVYCKSTTPPIGEGDMFIGNGNTATCKIYVPTDSVDAYKSASGWSEYADAIVGYDF